MNEDEKRKKIEEIRELLGLSDDPDSFWEGSESPLGFRLFKTHEEALAYKRKLQEEKRKRIEERKKIARERSKNQSESISSDSEATVDDDLDSLDSDE